MQPPAIARPFGVGLCLSLSAILFGFLLGGAFGSIEGSIKRSLDQRGTAALESVYKGDVAAKDAVVKKSWEYLQRAHLHGGAMGTAALACTLVLILTAPSSAAAYASSLALGVGALLYPLFWLVAGFMAPGLGSTGAAKESLKFMAVPGAGLSILGVCGTLYCAARAAFSREPSA